MKRNLPNKKKQENKIITVSSRLNVMNKSNNFEGSVPTRVRNSVSNPNEEEVGINFLK